MAFFRVDSRAAGLLVPYSGRVPWCVDQRWPAAAGLRALVAAAEETFVLTPGDLQRDWAVALTPAVHAVGHPGPPARWRAFARPVASGHGHPMASARARRRGDGSGGPGRRAGALPGRGRRGGLGRRRLLLGPGGACARRRDAGCGHARSAARFGVGPAARHGIRRGGRRWGCCWTISSSSERLGCSRRPPWSSSCAERRPPPRPLPPLWRLPQEFLLPCQIPLQQLGRGWVEGPVVAEGGVNPFQELSLPRLGPFEPTPLWLR